eukprot:NODE_2299_length_1622_cov_42.072048_g1971_i0.p1 GENE.NODE_2299_length_1622_cov_42.072048_g1971_i0~~NODE_2299_length_1622_cov_42.072048_g1971_i0.p1  ORF type:complete len:253 (+),score=50.95 NODE_2299_length_1622_cov_42.072048_g1971_i0:818-1576(+)
MGSTVQFYAIIDTGLQYTSKNPATGGEQEKCVLAVRQRQSRAFVSYQGYNFSGSLLMSGEDYPPASLSTSNGLAIRKTLMKYGVTCEAEPRSIYYDNIDKAESDLDGCWNLQADANLTHFMDFSDYYTLPNSHLNKWWSLTPKAFQEAFALERPTFQSNLLNSPNAMRNVFGCTDITSDRLDTIRFELSSNDSIKNAANKVSPEGIIIPGKPKYCQCWFMELDDSEMSKWTMDCNRKETLENVFLYINQYLP